MKILPKNGLFILALGLIVLVYFLISKNFVSQPQQPKMPNNYANDSGFEYQISSIKEFILFRDGGTIGILAELNSGEEFRFCIDRRIGSPLNPPAGFIFIDATHPSEEGARGLEIGGVQEKLLLTALARWLENNYSQETLDRLSNIDTTSELSEQEHTAYMILSIIDKK